MDDAERGIIFVISAMASTAWQTTKDRDYVTTTRLPRSANLKFVQPVILSSPLHVRTTDPQGVLNQNFPSLKNMYMFSLALQRNHRLHSTLARASLLPAHRPQPQQDLCQKNHLSLRFALVQRGSHHAFRRLVCMHHLE